MTTGLPTDDLDALALSKMTRVLGAARAGALMREVLAEVGMQALRTPNDLLRFAGALSTRGGFEGAVGALLSVQAAMRGAFG